MKRLSGIVLIAALFSAIFLGCSGKEGPAGTDGTSVDNIPPVIDLLEPAHNGTYRDSIRVRVNATDNSGIKFVRFYLDGSANITDTTFAEAKAAPYYFNFDFLKFDIREGSHSIMARAFDLENNTTDTPTIIVNVDRTPGPGFGVIRHWKPDSTNVLTMPRFSNQEDVASIIDTSYNVRFSAKRDFKIDSIRIFMTKALNEEMLYNSDLRMQLFPSNGVYPLGNAPVESYGTLTFDLPEYQYSEEEPDITFEPQWIRADITEADAEVLTADTYYHAVFNLTTPTVETHMGWGVSYVPKYNWSVENHSGVFHVDQTLPQWKTMDEFSPDLEYSKELMIEFYVTYQ